MIPEVAYAVALAGLPGIGPARLRTLVHAFGAARAWARVLAGGEGPGWAAAAGHTDVAATFARHSEAGIVCHLLGTPDYPPRLAADPEAPVVVFCRGSPAALDRPLVAVVGTRRCTHAGRRLARSFGEELTRAGAGVLSGLALGIDGAAHEGALAAWSHRAVGSADGRATAGSPAPEPTTGRSGATGARAAADGADVPAAPVAVVGSGLDVVYPRRHRALWEAIGERGLLLSEWPLGVRPEPWRFPARNRLLAALADVVVVVESHHAGGSLHTVEAADTRGRTVLAVPGAVGNPAAAGTNRLLFDGYGVARDATDVLVALGLATVGRGRRGASAGTAGVAESGPPGLDDTDVAVLEAVGWEPTSTEEVLVRTCLSPPEVAAALARLEHDAWVRGDAGWWERTERSK